MPVSFEISSSTGPYAVRIEPGALTALTQGSEERVWLIDDFFAGHAALKGLDTIPLSAVEPTKSLDQMTDVIVALRDHRATRATTLMALGGGVVQDVSAFSAAIYMRGIRWIYVPTTLLSMVDSCIGGKSSINVGKYKNIVGTFHSPAEVVIDPELIATLSTEQLAAGLCEAAKICLCRSADCFADYLALDPANATDAASMAKVIALSLTAKKWFIEIDEFDRNERLVLNFGHTFGHAIEAASNFGVNHGIAVGLGMQAALHLGEAMGLSYQSMPRIDLFRCHISELVSTVDGLREVLAQIDPAALMDTFRSDKKHTRSQFAVIMVAANGSVERRMIPRDAETESLIARAFALMLDDWALPGRQKGLAENSAHYQRAV